MRKIGILGSGDVAQALGRGFARHGWEVMIGSRTPSSKRLTKWTKASGRRARTGTLSEAVAFGDVVLLALRGTATVRTLRRLGPSGFRDKLVLDVTNPIDYSGGRPYGLFVGTTDSLGERVQRALPDSFVVKCFNAVNNSQMIDPKFSEKTPPMFICGDSAGEKRRTAVILRELGWPGVIDVGRIDAARWLEALVPLFIRVGTRLRTVRHAFKVVM